jgi:hypothetical protein
MKTILECIGWLNIIEKLALPSEHNNEETIKSIKHYLVKFMEYEKNLINRIVGNTDGGLTEREKSLIFWFMGLTTEMLKKGYTELAIASIDLDSWYEYYKDNENPLTALELDERDGA